MKTEIITVDPSRLQLLEQNARFMRHETFSRLVQNVKEDAVLTQLPFCAILGYYSPEDEIPKDEDGEPVWEVLSGNHRVRAAITAGLKQIQIQVTYDPLSRDRRKAIQLSHNAISGEDDPAILKTIYDSISTPSLRIYSGLDDQALGLLQDIDPDSISEANLTFQTISMLFLPDEIKEAEKVWEEAKKTLAGNKQIWIVRWAEYDKVMDALETASFAYTVRNTATAMLLILDVFNNHLEDLAEGWVNPDETTKKNVGKVPIDTILGSRMLSPKVALQLRKVVQKMKGKQEIVASIDAVAKLADLYLEGPEYGTTENG